MTWVCLQCGEYHEFNFSDICTRCGLKRPMNYITKRGKGNE
jgi:ABC-type ATPase with predicted acetyltransferase domain